METEEIRIREVLGGSDLPERLGELKLMGSYLGKLILSTQDLTSHLKEDSLILTYSTNENRINERFRIKKGGGISSASQQGSTLYLGTRWGQVLSIDMASGKKIEETERFGNNIDCLTANGAVYFGVNGRGVCKSDLGLKTLVDKEGNDPKGNKLKIIKVGNIFNTQGEGEMSEEDRENLRDFSENIPPRPKVASAMASYQGKIITFYFSNGNDPLLGEGPAGGLVEIIDKDLNSIKLKNGTPYAVGHAISKDDKIFFATRDESNGWIQNGSGEIYSLDPETLKHNVICNFPASVRCLHQGKEDMLVGLKDGTLKEVDTEGKSRTLFYHGDGSSISGIAVEDNRIYVAHPKGRITILSNT